LQVLSLYCSKFQGVLLLRFFELHVNHTAWLAAANQAAAGQAKRMQDDAVWSPFFCGLAPARKCSVACFFIMRCLSALLWAGSVAPRGLGSRETEFIRVSVLPGRDTPLAPALPGLDGQPSNQTAKCCILGACLSWIHPTNHTLMAYKFKYQVGSSAAYAV
jgi:hypothetical protein